MLSAEQGVMPHEWCRNYTRTRARPPERFSVQLHHTRWRNHRAHIGCHGREIRDAIQRRENAGGENQGRAPCECTLPSCQREALCRPDLRDGGENLVQFVRSPPYGCTKSYHSTLDIVS